MGPLSSCSLMSRKSKTLFSSWEGWHLFIFPDVAQKWGLKWKKPFDGSINVWNVGGSVPRSPPLPKFVFRPWKGEEKCKQRLLLALAVSQQKYPEVGIQGFFTDKFSFAWGIQVTKEKKEKKRTVSFGSVSMSAAASVYLVNSGNML